jgi:FMN phosphatase YigB (HAD superfamily)
MKVVLFDLGETLEHNDVLRDGAIETLEGIKSLKEKSDPSFVLGLASDFGFASNDEEIKKSKTEYYNILTKLGIKKYFEPNIDTNVTLSTEARVTKDQNFKKFIEKVIEKIDNNTNFTEIIFITEEERHIKSANELHMETIFLNLNNILPNNKLPTITNLKDSVNIIKDFINQ